MLPSDVGPVQLVVTSPPYNVGISYDEHDDVMDADEWREMVHGVLLTAWGRLVPGGRMAVNILKTSGRSPAIPIGHEIEGMLLHYLPDSMYRGAIIWNKGAAAGTSTAWGSFASPANPVLRGTYEMIYVVSKGDLTLKPRVEGASGDISRAEFTAATLDVWSDLGGKMTTTQGQSGHPAAFPVSLPRRLIQLYSFPGDVVLDPFFGSGTTGRAAEALGRDWVGVDISEEYCKLAARTVLPFGEVQIEHLGR